MGVIGAVRSLGVALIAAASFAHDPTVWIVLAGGVIWAAATFGKNRRTVAFENTRDLKARVDLLESEKGRLVKDVADLEAELKQRPALGSLEALLRQLIGALTDHDAGTASLGQALLAGQQEIAVGLDTQSKAIDRNTAAVQLWATEKAKAV